MKKRKQYNISISYTLYDKDGNYAYEGHLEELSKFLGRKKNSLTASISHIKNQRGNRKYVMDKYGKKYTVLKVEE